MNTSTRNKFYVVAAPIGNLADVSERVRHTLNDCNLIAAEDTRVTRKLLSALGITGKKIVSVRQHNEVAMAIKLTNSCDCDICYLCDAGTPAISDPGDRVVAEFYKAGWQIVPIAGPSAVIAALSASGIRADSFTFLGFLPPTVSKIKQRLLEVAGASDAVIFYLPPRRIAVVTQLLAELAPQALICVCRELSKLHEQIVCDRATVIAQAVQSGQIPARGEFTIVAGLPKPELASNPFQIAILLNKELPIAKAAKLAAKICNVDARIIYKQLLQDG